MTRGERLEILIEIINRKKRVSYNELKKQVFCSTSTLRRDLIALENEGMIKRLHGEVMLNTFNTLEIAHSLRGIERINEKKAIASLAKDFIGPGMCLYLDSSTTVFELCPYICEIDHLIIFTNGLNVALKFAEYGNPTMKVFINSGEIKHHSSSVINTEMNDGLINHFNIDIAFCSASGIDCNGVYEASLSQALSKKRIMERSNQTILLMDHSKFNETKFFKIADLNEYYAIISDTKPNDDLLEVTANHDIEWLVHQ